MGGILKFIGGAVVVLFLISVAVGDKDKSSSTASSSASSSRAGIQPTLAVTASRPSVRIDGAHCGGSASSSFIYSEGEITNTSGETLKSVQVVVSLRDSAGILITSDTAYIEIDPLLPNQSSPYKAMSRNNPAITKCGVDGAKYRGGQLDVTVNYAR